MLLLNFFYNGTINRTHVEEIMGEAKRRKEALGDKYGKEEQILSWLPITKSQSEKFIKWTTTGSWIGIGLLIVSWLTVRFIGPAFGWWEIN
jgi:hypothetical protein